MEIKNKEQTILAFDYSSSSIINSSSSSSFGYKFQIEMINKQLLDVVNALFVVLTILGIVTDPTTPGLSDRKGDK